MALGNHIEWNTFSINGKAVSEEEFWKFENEQTKKKDVTWYEFAKENSLSNSEIKRLFLEYVLNENNDEILEYRVDEIETVSGEEKEELLYLLNEVDGGTYKDTDVFVNIMYAFRPTNVNDFKWIIDHGQVEGEWIAGKNMSMCIRDGEIISTSTVGWW